MRNLLSLLAAFAAATSVRGQEMVTIPTRPGVTQSFLVAEMDGRKPEAVALLYIGGSGNINLRVEDGRIEFAARNFLPRSRSEFARNAILPVVMDVPSDQRDLPDHYRMGGEQTADARAVIGELKKRYPGLPVYVVGTSRGTLSAAYVSRALGDDIAGVVLTSSLFASRRRGGSASLQGFDYASIKVPLLFVHHREDACDMTPYSRAAGLADRYPLVSVNGGRPAESGPCDPLSAHGFLGKEAETVDAIAAWMLKRPLPKEIGK